MKNTKIIVMMGLKGGLGKSTSAMILANRLHFAHQRKVVLIDSDDQTSVLRKRERDQSSSEDSELFKIIEFQSPQRSRWFEALKEHDGKADFVIIDTGATLSGEEKPFLVEVADIIVSPIVANELDVDSFVLFMNALKPLADAFKKKVLILKNRYDQRNPDQRFFDKHFHDPQGAITLNSKLRNRRAFSRMPLTTIQASESEFIDFANEILKHLA